MGEIWKINLEITIKTHENKFLTMKCCNSSSRALECCNKAYDPKQKRNSLQATQLGGSNRQESSRQATHKGGSNRQETTLRATHTGSNRSLCGMSLLALLLLGVLQPVAVLGSNFNKQEPTHRGNNPMHTRSNPYSNWTSDGSVGSIRSCDSQGQTRADVGMLSGVYKQNDKTTLITNISQIREDMQVKKSLRNPTVNYDNTMSNSQPASHYRTVSAVRRNIDERRKSRPTPKAKAKLKKAKKSAVQSGTASPGGNKRASKATAKGSITKPDSKRPRRPTS